MLRGAVEVSIDAGTRDTYTQVKGKDALGRVIDNIARYREHGQVNLKYIGGSNNLGDDDIEGFVKLTARLAPNIVTVTPEWSEYWKGDYAGGLTRQIAKLIHLLGETGLHVVPGNQAERKQFFPNSWSELELELTRFVGRFAA